MDTFHAGTINPNMDSGHRGPPAPRPRKRARSEKINYPKKRVSVACEVCRARKTRCDAAKPTCSFCAEVGADCIYRRQESEERFVDKASPPISLLEEDEIIGRLDRIERLLQNQKSCGIPRDTTIKASPLLENGGVDPLIFHKSAYDGHRPLTVGLNLSGLSRFFNRPCPTALTPLCHDDYEEQLELQLEAGDGVFLSGPVHLDTLNLGPRRCWQLQQIFSKDILPWCPIIDQQAISELASRVVESGFDPWNLETCLTLLVLALGSFAEGSQHLDDDPNHFPGIEYFRAAYQLVDTNKIASNTILYVQCQILISFYLLYSLRPMQAYESIRAAGLKIIYLLQLRTRLEADSQYREMCHRAFWACYLVEHELQGYIPFSALLLQVLHDDVPLPTSDYEEPGIYWFLSEIAIRRIFTRPRNGIGWNMHILYEPVIADEIAAQMAQWQTNLPHPIKFVLEDTVHLRPLLDPHKVFLRAQYFAISSVLFWQYVVRLLSGPPTNANNGSSPQNCNGEATSREYMRVHDAAAKSLRYAVIHVYAVESLFQSRHLMLMANFNGLYTVALLLLCTYDVPTLESIQPPRRREAILTAWRCLKNLEANRPIRRKVERIEEMMRMSGIEPY